MPDINDAGRNSLADSYRFHRELESFPEFLRRERTPLLLFGLTFSLILTAFIVTIDESFFYSRIQTDALWYYLKGKEFTETGRTTLRLAINIRPYVFASAPGILRAPFIAAFDNFDDQLRAIQLANIVIVDAIAVMCAYMLSWVIARRWHWLVIAFSFAFTAMAPWWIQNVFVPLTDAPYAAFSLAAVLIAIAIMRSERPSTEKTLLVAFVIAAAAAFPFRYTEPAILVLVAALLWGRPGERKRSPRSTGIIIAVIVAIGVLVIVNRETIFGKYVHELYVFARRAEPKAMFLNLFCLAIPQQIIPAFDLGFSHPPIVGLFHASFWSTPSDAAWSFLGMLISAAVVAGAWRSRRRFAPEILLVLAVLPALALMMPSTPRYLMTYQAFFWIFFYEGCLLVAQLIPPGLRVASRVTAVVGVAAALAIGLGLGLRHRGLLGSGRARNSSLSISGYVHGQTNTYRPLATFMATLPRDRTILVAPSSNVGRWKAISGLDYYHPDSALSKAAATRDMYLVLDCGSPIMCQIFSRDEARIEKTMAKYGNFRYEPVFEASAEKSRAKVFRVRLADDSVNEVPETKKGNL